MSVANSIAAWTLGLLWRGCYGVVDPWTLLNIKEETEVAMLRAVGVRRAGESQVEYDARLRAAEAEARKAAQELDNFLKGIGEHPDDAMKASEDFVFWLKWAAVAGVALAAFFFVRRLVGQK
jgi:hypothetical protein